MGFMVGMREEQNGIICAGSRLITAISLLRSPKITLHVGPAYGAGYYAMCGKPYEPDFIISWPRYHLAVMGADNAAKVMVAIKSRKTELSDEVKREIFNKIHEQYTSESRSDFCTKKGFDDCMIDPKDTKRVICRILELLDKKMPIKVHHFTDYQLVVIDRDEKRGALDLDHIKELIAIFSRDHKLPLVLTGSGRCFCSGLDLSYLQQANAEKKREINLYFGQLLQVFADIAHLTVVVANGPVVAGGCGLYLLLIM